MPKITDLVIQKNNKSRANLYLDGEFVCGVEMLTVMKLGLKIGNDISEQKWQEAVFDSEKSVAFGKAVDYLGRGMKTSKQIKDYLVKKDFAPAVVDYVVQKLKEYRYIDDNEYARLFVEQNSKNKGERRLKQELQQRGISREAAELASEMTEEEALANASALAQKYMKNKGRDVKDMQRLQRYLLSRGYNFDTVNSVLRSFKLDDDWYGKKND